VRLTAAQEADFRRFVESRWHGLVRSAYLLVGGDHHRAEDLVQSVLVKVHRRWDRIEPTGAPVAYVRAALANQAISDARRARVTETLLSSLSSGGRDDPPEGFDADPRDAYRQLEDRDAVVGALRELPPRMRAVVVLRYFEDLTEAATAEALGMSVGSVKSQTSRGLDRLRTALTAGPDPTGTRAPIDSDSTEGSMR
jgi:RNA polymerase sigma-70 factor (sigma-E family)